MEAATDLLIYSLGGFVLKQAVEYLRDRAQHNKRSSEEEQSETASSHNVEAQSGSGRSAGRPAPQSVSSGHAGPSLPVRSSTRRTASHSTDLPGPQLPGPDSGLHAASGPTGSAAFVSQPRAPSAQLQTSSEQPSSSPQPSSPAPVWLLGPRLGRSFSGSLDLLGRHQSTSASLPTQDQASIGQASQQIALFTPQRAPYPDQESAESPCEAPSPPFLPASPTLPCQPAQASSPRPQSPFAAFCAGLELDPSPSAPQQPVSDAAGPSDTAQQPQHLLAPQPSSLMADRTPDIQPALSPAAAPAAGTAAAGPDLPADPAAPAAAFAAAGQVTGRLCLGRPRQLASPCSALARRLNDLRASICAQPSPLGVAGAAEPEQGSLMTGPMIPSQVPTPERFQQIEDAPGPAPRRTFIDLASSDEDPEDSQAARDVHAEQPLPSQVPDTGMDSAEDIQRAAQDEDLIQLATAAPPVCLTETRPCLPWAPNTCPGPSARSRSGRSGRSRSRSRSWSRSPSPQSGSSSPSSLSGTSSRSTSPPEHDRPALRRPQIRRPLVLGSASTSSSSQQQLASSPSSSGPSRSISPVTLPRRVRVVSCTPNPPPHASPPLLPADSFQPCLPARPASSSEPSTRASLTPSSPSEQRLPLRRRAPSRSASPPAQQPASPASSSGAYRAFVCSPSISPTHRRAIWLKLRQAGTIRPRSLHEHFSSARVPSPSPVQLVSPSPANSPSPDRTQSSSGGDLPMVVERTPSPAEQPLQHGLSSFLPAASHRSEQSGPSSSLPDPAGSQPLHAQLRDAPARQLSAASDPASEQAGPGLYAAMPAAPAAVSAAMPARSSSPQPLQHLWQPAAPVPARPASPASSLSTPRQASPGSPENAPSRFFSRLHHLRSPMPSAKRPLSGIATRSFPSKRSMPAAGLHSGPHINRQAGSEILDFQPELEQPDAPISPWAKDPQAQPSMQGAQHADAAVPAEWPRMSPMSALLHGRQEQGQLFPRTPAPYSSLPTATDEPPSAERSRTPHPYSNPEPQAPFTSQAPSTAARPSPHQRPSAASRFRRSLDGYPGISAFLSNAPPLFRRRPRQRCSVPSPAADGQASRDSPRTFSPAPPISAAPLPAPRIVYPATRPASGSQSNPSGPNSCVPPSAAQCAPSPAQAPTQASAQATASMHHRAAAMSAFRAQPAPSPSPFHVQESSGRIYWDVYSPTRAWDPCPAPPNPFRSGRAHTFDADDEWFSTAQAAPLMDLLERHP